ncbi:hypothetical protein [Rhizobium sp. K102]|jgi:hypothetical protein|uniref:hypothetical protein n=1 Tax=Rhizobium sp. K102 TaxID=2918527 RepID=UPI001EFC0646|nr:hypothetical protein [Rhizobium sp. K102]ULR47393.1 hypothetical protein MHI61_28870 [Rhizobium sp. K102]
MCGVPEQVARVFEARPGLCLGFNRTNTKLEVGNALAGDAVFREGYGYEAGARRATTSLTI